MLLRASLDLPIAAATAADRLSAVLARNGPAELADEAYQAGAQTLIRVGPLGDTPGFAKTVRVETLAARSIVGGVRIPFRWVATGPGGRLFPTLDANLDVTALDEQRSTLSINASYTPPFGATGAGLDRLVLHRAARATMYALLHGLAEAAIPSGKPGEISFLPDEPAGDNDEP
jgi:hypothetical protein